MKKIKTGDEVQVICGRDKGKTGSVIAIRKDGTALVNGIQIVKRHTKPNPNLNQPGGIVQKEAPIDLSNLMVIDRSSGKAGRVGIKQLKDGKNVRFLKSTGEVID